jgi:ribosomal protein S18 acetylase RimI-like enzyme
MAREPKMLDCEILFEPYPDDELKCFVTEGVDLHTIAVTGMSDWYPCNFFVKSDRGEWLGGLYGNIWGGWLHVKALWVIKSDQRRGHGRRLLQAAESYSLEKGCRAASLETFSFQARHFYEKLGYEVFGQLKDYPPGHVKYFLTNRLQQTQPAS